MLIRDEADGPGGGGGGGRAIVQELCKSRSGRPGLSVLTSLLVSVGKPILNHASALVPTCP